MAKRPWLIACSVLAAMLCLCPCPSSAQGCQEKHQAQKGYHEFQECDGHAGEAGPAEKFSRGLLNSVGGLAGEVTLNVFHRSVGDEGSDDFLGVAAGAVCGLVYGVMDGAVRMGAGLVDLFTFPVAINGSYEPLVEPEFPI